jgi:hypothetical protein
MLALGLLLNIAGIGVFCWLIFTLAVYALPLGGTAWMRLTIFTEPGALEPGRAVSGAPLPAFTATRE